MNERDSLEHESSRIALSSNGVLMVVEGEQQTRQSLLLLQKELAKKTSELREQGQKILILIDMSRVVGYGTDSYDIAKELLLHLDFDSMAVFGMREKFAAGANELIAATNQQQKIHFFDSSTDAARWLAEDVVQTKSAIEALAHPIWPPRRKKRTI